MTTPDRIRAAGHILKQIREQTYDYTQRDISRLSREKWGEEGEIDQAVLSKIERGALAKPLNLREAAELAILYNKPLSWIAGLYGLPVVIVEGRPEEPAVDKLSRVLHGLSATDQRREQLIRWVEFAIEQTLFASDNEQST